MHSKTLSCLIKPYLLQQSYLEEYKSLHLLRETGSAAQPTLKPEKHKDHALQTPPWYFYVFVTLHITGRHLGHRKLKAKNYKLLLGMFMFLSLNDIPNIITDR